MTLTLDSGQETLSKRSSIACLPLVVMETYTDRDAETVDSTYYWTRGMPLNYSWDDVSDFIFHPRILSVSPIARGFPHIPDANVLNTREAVTVTLDSTDRAGTFLFDELIAENLIGARVTIASLLVDLSTALNDPRYWDLTALGQIHEVRWRGELTDVPEMRDDNQTFSLVFETEEIPIAWPIAVDLPLASPSGFGVRYPVVAGTVENVKLVPIDVGAATTLTSEINSSVTSLDIDDVAGFNFYGGALGYLSIDGEAMSFTTISGNSISGIVRNTELWDDGFQKGAAAHSQGAVVLSHPDQLQYGLSGVSAYQANQFYLIDKDGELQDFTSPLAPWLNCNDFIDRGGMRAFLSIPNETFRYSQNGKPSTGDPTRLNGLGVDVFANFAGAYTLSTSVRLIEILNDATNWTAISGTISDVGTGVRCTCGAASDLDLFQRSVSSTNRSHGDFTFTINITQTNLDELERFIFRPSSGSDGMTVYIYPTQMVAGDNDFRIASQSMVLGEFLTALSLISIDVEFKSNNRFFELPNDLNFEPATEIADHPLDVVAWFVQVYSGLDKIDAPSFSTAETNLPGVTVNGDLTGRANTFASIIASFGFESRTNFVWNDSGGQYLMKAFNADSGYDFPTSSRTLTDFTKLQARPRLIGEIANRFSALFKLVAGQNARYSDQYQGSIVSNEFRNDIESDVATSLITTSQTEYGIRDSSALGFSMLNDEASVKEVFAYYVTETLRAKAVRYSMVVPWWDSYDLEAGDIVEFTPRWLSAAVKCRITQTIFDFDQNGVGLNLEEVT